VRRCIDDLHAARCGDAPKLQVEAGLVGRQCSGPHVGHGWLAQPASFDQAVGRELRARRVVQQQVDLLATPRQSLQNGFERIQRTRNARAAVVQRVGHAAGSELIGHRQVAGEVAVPTATDHDRVELRIESVPKNLVEPFTAVGDASAEHAGNGRAGKESGEIGCRHLPR